jgi:hypothetical protein
MTEAAHDTGIDYIAPPTVHKFITTIGRAKYIQGPFGSGKSVGACFDRVLAGTDFYEKYPDSKLKSMGIKEDIRKRRTLVVRNTWPELRETTLKSFMEWFSMYGHWVAGTKTFTFNSHPHEFVFLGLDRPDDVKKVKSLEITDFILDEASEIEHEIFLGLMGRRGRYPKLKDKALYDEIDWMSTGVCASNPPEDDHWLVDEFDTNPKPEYYAYYQPGGMYSNEQGNIVPNPNAENLNNLPIGYYEQLWNDYASRPDLQKRYVLGQRAVIVRGKGVYEGVFNKAMHVTTEMPHYPAGATVWTGQDNSGNVPAAVLGWVNPNGVLDIVKEFTTDRSGIVDFTGALVQHRQAEYPGSKVGDVSDPAGHAEFSDPNGGLTSNAKIVKEKFGIDLIKGIQKFAIRREAVAEYLTKMVDGGPKIRIYAPGCPRLVAGLEGGYCYRKLPGDGGYSPEPDKNKFSHVVESLQYLCSYLIGYKERSEPFEVLKPSRGWSG